VPVSPAALSGAAMKKTSRKVAERLDPDRDTMRPEYDFSKAVRGVTAARYRTGTNVILLDPDVNALFPDSAAVNEALRTFARLVKPRRRSRSRPRST
jgi:hypothetical protein